jgi:putative ABC transport system permease protein
MHVLATSVITACGTLARDLRYRARALRADPAIGLIVVVIVAFGIGATTTMFSLVKAVLLEPLPFASPDRLVRLWESSPARGVAQVDVSAPNFHDWQEQQTVFERVAASEMATFTLTGSGDPERVAAARITANLVPTLGVQPLLGRGFLPEEERPGPQRVALIGYGLWQRRFGGDPALVNTTVQLNGESYTIVGVMPIDFDFPRGRELWVPLVLDAAREPWRADRTNRGLAVFARLAPDVSVRQALARMNALARRLEGSYPATNSGWGVRLLTFDDWILPEPVRRATMVLSGAVGLLLLLACANVANLLLARAVARRREIATHAALGASRARLVRHLLLESLLLAGAGAIAGVLLTLAGTKLMGSVTIPDVARLDRTAVDGQVLAFALLISAITGLAFGIVPAWWASRPNLAEVLKTGGSSGASRSIRRLGGILVSAQIGLTVAVLICAALLARSFVEIRRLPLGFAADNVLTFQINLPGSKYGTREQRVDFYDQLLERLRTIPGVMSAGATTHAPLSASEWKLEITLDGSDAAARQGEGEGVLAAEARAVTPGYFQTVGIAMKRGRDFGTQDRGAAEPRLIVSETFARRYWPNDDAIGKRFRPGPTSPFGTIIGIVADVRSTYQEEPRPAFYFAYSDIGMPSLAIAVHTGAEAAGVIPAVRSVLRTMDAAQPIYNVRTMGQVVATATAQPRFQAVVLGLLGTAALVLAAFGTYSMIAYLVRQQRQEIALRIALGADGGAVLRLIVRQCMTYVLPGLALGLAGSFALTQVMASLLFRVSATDPITFTTIPLLLIGVALAACYLPARHAARVNPLVALRRE